MSLVMFKFNFKLKFLSDLKSVFKSFKTNMSTSNSKYKISTHCFPNLLMLIHKDEIHKGALPNFLSVINSTEGLPSYFWIKNILEQSPKIKTFRNVLQSSTVFHFGMFYKVLQNSIETFFNIRESSRLFFYLFDCSICLSTD